MKRKSLIRTLAIIAGFVLLVWAFTMVGGSNRDYKPESTSLVVAQLEAAAGANDQTACRAAARAMRVAGVIMPPPLLALAALIGLPALWFLLRVTPPRPRRR